MRNNYIEAMELNKPHFKNEALRLAEKFKTDAYIEDGVIRWKSNNSVPPNDILEFWNYLGYDFDLEKSIKTSDEDTATFLEQYRKNYKSPSQEELYEMEAAFGKGTTVVDIITGKKIKL